MSLANLIHTYINHSVTAQKPKSTHRALHIGSIVGKVILLAPATYLVVGFLIVNRISYGKRVFNQSTPQTYGMDYEEITLRTPQDNLTIAGWYIPALGDRSDSSSPAIVMVHGWNSSRNVAFGGHFLELAQALQQAGFSVLMIDLRGHGQSAEAHSTSGEYERREVLAAVDFLLGRGHPPGKIGLLGVSMGGSAAIGVAARNAAVGAVVVDSTCAEMRPVIEHFLDTNIKLPYPMLVPVFETFALVNGFDPAHFRPIDEIHLLSPRPLLMIQCLADDLVTVDHFYRLRQAAPWAQTWLVQECEHANIYSYHPQEYREKVVTFFQNSFDQP